MLLRVSILIPPRCQRGQDIGGATTETGTGQYLQTFVQFSLLPLVYQDMTLVLSSELGDIFKLVSQILKVFDMSYPRSCPPDASLDSFLESICDS